MRMKIKTAPSGPPTLTPPSEEEKEGIKMIQHLLGMSGGKESEEVSLRNWRSFSTWEKENTKAAYAIFKSK